MGDKTVVQTDVRDELPDGARCMWQICPHELPKNMHPMALEMWLTPDGKLVLFQIFIEGPRKGDWWKRITSVARFDQVLG